MFTPLIRRISPLAIVTRSEDPTEEASMKTRKNLGFRAASTAVLVVTAALDIGQTFRRPNIGHSVNLSVLGGEMTEIYRD